MIFSAMLRTLGLLVIASAFISAQASQAQSKAPDPATLTLSLKTLSKALAGCRTSYLRVQNGTNIPFLKTTIGATDYEKDMTSLTHAETFVNVMAAHPERVTGKSLVATLSSTDDFYAGVGSTRLAILGNLISAKKVANPPNADELIVASTLLADCQAAVFNAGDDFVDLVMNYVGAEDDIVAARPAKVHAK
jgi:hypothetical protein